MCFPTPKMDNEKESMQENIRELFVCIENGEKILCKLFKKTKKNGSNHNRKDK